MSRVLSFVIRRANVAAAHWHLYCPRRLSSMVFHSCSALFCIGAVLVRLVHTPSARAGVIWQWRMAKQMSRRHSQKAHPRPRGSDAHFLLFLVNTPLPEQRLAHPLPQLRPAVLAEPA